VCSDGRYMVCHPRRISAMRHLRGIHRTHSQAKATDWCSQLSGSDACRLAWWESSSHAADGRLPTTSSTCAVLQLDTSFRFVQNQLLFSRIACGSAACRAAVRSLTPAPKQHSPHHVSPAQNSTVNSRHRAFDRQDAFGLLQYFAPAVRSPLSKASQRCPA